MKFQDLKQKPKNETERLLKDFRDKLRQLHFDLASGKAKNVKELREIKKDIARILTISHQDSGKN